MSDGVKIENGYLRITNIVWNQDASNLTDPADPKDMEYHFEKDVLLKEISEDQQTPTTVIEAADPEQNAILAFQGQKRNQNFDFRMYNDGSLNDKTNGTLAEAGLADARIAPGPIRDVDTTNDEVEVPGDQRDRAPVGETVAIDTKGQAPDNDGVYSVTSVSYDSGNDTTTIGIDGDLTDSTAIGAISNAVVTVWEQLVFLQNYIDNSNIGVQGRLYGLHWSDPDGDGVEEGLPVRVNRFRFRKQSNDPLRGNGILQMDVGFST